MTMDGDGGSNKRKRSPDDPRVRVSSSSYCGRSRDGGRKQEVIGVTSSSHGGGGGGGYEWNTKDVTLDTLESNTGRVTMGSQQQEEEDVRVSSKNKRMSSAHERRVAASGRQLKKLEHKVNKMIESNKRKMIKSNNNTRATRKLKDITFSYNGVNIPWDNNNRIVIPFPPQSKTIQPPVDSTQETTNKYPPWVAPYFEYKNIPFFSPSQIRKLKRSYISGPHHQYEDDQELKAMEMLPSNDEAFLLPVETFCDILDVIRSLKTPTPQTYKRWNQLARSAYRKLCLCFDVDYTNLEATPDRVWKRGPSTVFKKQIEEDNKSYLAREARLQEVMTLVLRYTQQKLKEEGRTDDHGLNLPFTTGSLRQFVDVLMNGVKWNNKYDNSRKRTHSGPYKFGRYSPEATPKSIPHQLYLLVKEAVDIRKHPEWLTDEKHRVDLLIVEGKIEFFCMYFSCHLPTGWTYDPENASDSIKGYDPKYKHKDSMDGYTTYPFPRRALTSVYDKSSGLAPHDMIYIMTRIHSRATPFFWNWCPLSIVFYFQLCSIFGIPYHNLEAASEDDVLLMNMGRLAEMFQIGPNDFK